MFGGTLPGIKMNGVIMITNTWETFGSLKYLIMIVQDFLEIWRIDDLDVGIISEHNCAIIPRCYFFRSFVILLELINFHGFPAIPLNLASFPSTKHFMKIS